MNVTSPLSFGRGRIKRALSTLAIALFHHFLCWSACGNISWAEMKRLMLDVNYNASRGATFRTQVFYGAFNPVVTHCIGRRGKDRSEIFNLSWLSFVPFKMTHIVLFILVNAFYLLVFCLHQGERELLFFNSRSDLMLLYYDISMLFFISLIYNC